MMMSETMVKKMVPVLRFGEFKGEWKKRKIGQFLIEYKKRVSSSTEYPILTSSRTGLFFQKNYFNNRELKNDGEYGVVPRGYFCYRHMSDDSTFKFNINNLVDNGAISKEYPVFTTENMDSYFLQQVLNEGILFKKFARTQKLGGTRVRLYFKKLVNFKPNLPSLPEQKKIASFLTTIDTRIQQLRKKQSLLEEYKKGVMQQIFSQEIRFKDEDGGAFEEWEEKRLGEFLIPTIREVNKPKLNYLAIGIRSHCKGTFQKPDFDPKKIMMEKLFEVKENDLIVNITFAWEGAIAKVKKEDEGGLVSHRFPTYTFNRELAIHEYFQFVFIQKIFRFQLDVISPGGAGRNRVMSKKEFLKIKWKMPSVPEQKKIANLLTAIDERIERVITQITEMENFKKGLLQQMFV